MQYGEMRWRDIEALDKRTTVVVCPLASLEQHGHHLPLLTDTLLVSQVAQRVEAAMPTQVALTPTLWLGASDHHMDFAGTVSVPNMLYVSMIKNMIRSFVKAGFVRILFLNGHGGNVAPATVAITEMVNVADAYERVLVALSSYWTLAGDAFAPHRHHLESKQVTHACEYETSMMLATRNELVDMSQATASAAVIDSRFYHSQHGGAVVIGNRFRCLTASGAMGNPGAATIEKGESLLQAAATETAAFIAQFLTWPLPAILKPKSNE